jgi:hypothetical protein
MKKHSSGVIGTLQDINEREERNSSLSRIFHLAKTVKKRKRVTKLSKDARMQHVLESMANLQAKRESGEIR